MKSGAYFSAVILIWITAMVVAFYMLYPDINKSIKSLENINTAEVSQLLNSDITESQDIDPIDYSPLAIFNLW
jgi:hypothetical protein